MNVVTARERRITALLCTLVALTCIFDVGQELYRGEPVRWLKVIEGVALLLLAGISLYRARHPSPAN